MRRALLFVALLGVFLVLTFPHRLLVERMLKSRLAELAVEVTLGEVAPAWPPGYHIDDLVLSRGPYTLDIDRLRLDLYWGGGMRFDADACGGVMRGSVTTGAAESEAKAKKGKGKRLEVVFTDIDPLACLRLDGLEIGGRFGGELRLADLGGGNPGSALGELAREGSLNVQGRDGTIAGSLPAFSAPGEGGGHRALPIGSWRFARAALEARIAGNDVVLANTDADAEGVTWEVTRGRLSPAGDSRVRIAGDFRARRNDDSTTSKALIGLLPKATERDDGWRRYRVSGTLDAPRLIGLK